MTGRSALDTFLSPDPRDAGCAQTLELLHVYAELTLGDGGPEERLPGLALHLRICGPCAEDYDGLLAALRNGGGNGYEASTDPSLRATRP